MTFSQGDRGHVAEHNKLRNTAAVANVTGTSTINAHFTNGGALTAAVG